MKQPKHLRDLASLTSSYLAFPLIALITSPILARALGPEGRGEVAALSAPATLAQTVAAFGLPIGASYFVARGTPGLEVFKKVLPFALFAGLGAYLVYFLLAPVLLRDYPELQSLFRLAGIAVAVVAVTDLVRGIQNGRKRYGLLSLERWTQALLRLGLIVTFAFAGVLTTTSAVWINVGCAVGASLLLLHKFIRPRFSNGEESSARTGVSRGGIVRYSLASWGGSISGAANARIDQAILILFVSPTSLGLYAVAATIAELPMTAYAAAQRILIGSAVGSEYIDRTKKALRLGVLFGLIATVIGALLAPAVIPFVFGAEFRGSVGLMQVLLLGVTPWGLSRMLTSALSALGKPGISSTIEFFGLALSLGGLALFAMRFGVLGAAWVSVISFSGIAVVKLFAYRKYTASTLTSLCIPGASDLRWVRDQIRRSARPT